MWFNEILTMYSPVESDLFFDESQVTELELGDILMVLLMDSENNKEWIPATIQSMSLSQISTEDLNKMNENLDIHSGNLWESGYFSNRRYSLTYNDEGVEQEMFLYFIMKALVGTPLDDDSPSMDTTGMTRGEIKQLLKPCSQIEESGPNAGEFIKHKSCTGLAYDPVSKNIVVWREPTPNEAKGAPEHVVPSRKRMIVTDEVDDSTHDQEEPLSILPVSKRRVISDEVDDTLTKRVWWPSDDKLKETRVITAYKPGNVKWAPGNSLESIREIPGLDKHFRDEYRSCNACVRGFMDFKGNLINPNMPVGDLLVNCVICLNDIISEADTKYRGMVNSSLSREMTQTKCFHPMAGTIARHPGLDVLVTNFVSDSHPSMSHQLRNDFMSILRSAFRFHGKTVTDQMPAGVPLNRQLHLVRLKPHESVKEGTYGLKINQTGAPGDPVNYSSP